MDDLTSVRDLHGTDPAAVSPAGPATLSADELRKMNAYWRAANYLSVGQVRLSWVFLARTPADLPPGQPQSPCAWLQGGGHNHNRLR